MKLAPLLLAAAACASTIDPGPRLAAPPRPALPDGVTQGSELWARPGGARLAVTWVRPRGAVRGVVVAHHGLKDHADRFLGFAGRLATAGFALYAYDMRGHGRSSGARVDLDVDALVGDLDAFIARVRAREPGRPLFLLGHSVGGLVTALEAIERRPEVRGVVLLAPAIAFGDDPFQIAALRSVAALAPRAAVLAQPNRWFSRDPRVVAGMDGDPLVHQGRGPARTAEAILDGVRRVWAGAARLEAPLLVIHGRPDKLTAAAGSRELVARAGGVDRTLRLLDRAEHDLLHEPEGAEVEAEIAAWMEARLDGPVAGVRVPAAGRLRGDRLATAKAFELRAGGERGGGETRGAFGLRGALSVGPTLGWHAAVELRGVVGEGGGVRAELIPAGLALRLGRAGEVSAGVGLGVGRGGLRVPIEAGLDLSTARVRVVARGAIEPEGEARALLGVRLGGDLRYWKRVTAGRGVLLAGSWRRVDDGDIWGLSLGVELWASD